jgi:hypothetical protein
MGGLVVLALYTRGTYMLPNHEFGAWEWQFKADLYWIKVGFAVLRYACYNSYPFVCYFCMTLISYLSWIQLPICIICITSDIKNIIACSTNWL